ncbi:MAG: response regulator, partial [Thermodesulfobacteriota bacterium]|nr:response regulator [Thermodesulfobacteriota bacterium]
MSRRLLLADDSVTIQKVIEITLSDGDYILSIASDGDEALQMAISERPDLILADVFMPGKNGYDVCEEVRKNADLKDVPVLLLAGTFEPFDQDKARAVGANDWIVKPFSSQALIDKVVELLAQTPAEEQWQATPSQAPGDQDILQALEEVVATQEVAPEPVAPEPVAPEPVAPEPVAPEPVAPEPVAPEPVAPEPVAPEPVA